MAHVSIISSKSGEQIFEGAPRYIGAYLKPGYLEFQAIGSPTAISWHVGDYVVYPRTGKTYRLYRTPQIAEQGDTMRYGAAFLYENVQFFDDSKRLELCPFTDLVPGDNTIHFSTQNVVSFFGKPLNVAERVQACLKNQYGAGTWAIRIVTTTDPDLLELLDTEVEFSVSGASCQQALDKVYELWNGLGWIHTVENGVNVITIGASNVRTNANTTVPFAYGNGLVRVERSIANADEIGTRLFAYGSMKNMDATYYRGLNIYHADSVDIEHLMIPLSEWGLTDGQPDARKAFIEDAAAIDKLGLIPRTAYFDGTGDLPDIHPTIERMTIGEVYDAGGAGYLPNLSKWSRDQRIDEIVSAVNPTDHGTSAEQGQKYTEDISSHLAALTDTFINNDTVSWTIFSVNTNNPGRLTINFGQEPQSITLTTAWAPQLDLKLAVYAGGKRVETPLTIRQASSTAWQIILPESVSVSGSSSGLVEVRIEGVITNTAGGQATVEGSFSTNASTAVTGGVEYELSKTFTVTIPQIGFDIEKYAALGNGKTISMKTGMCAGRDFEIKSAKYVSSTDSWLLALYRSSDEDLGIMFPNADYQIAAGDQYVLLDIAMPDMYVTVASNRLLEAARKLLADISSERPFYSPQIDAKVVYNENRVLLEGMWMDVTFDAAREYVLIDSITIDENGSNIPTYEISLRERKGIEWTENVGKSSSSRSSVSVNGGDTEQTGGVRSVGMTVPTGLTVQGSPITGAGIFKVGLAEGYKIPLISELANYFELAADPTLVQLRQAYSYLGVRKGLIFDANAEADTNADFEKVALPGGGYALHSKLPFYSDSFISAGGISPGGGSSVGNATLVAQTYGGTLSATGINPINFYSKERVDQLLATAGTVQTVAGVSPTSGDIPVASLKSALGLGAAAAYGIGSVASGNTGLVTGGSVYSAINEAVSSVMKMQGTTTTPITDGSTTNPVVIDGSSYTAKKGDVVLYDGKEYLWAGSAWEQLGDEASWALKTTSISAGTGLEGGGTLASNRTISINSTYQTYINHGESAYNSLGDYLPLTGGVISNNATIYPLVLNNNDSSANAAIGMHLSINNEVKGVIICGSGWGNALLNVTAGYLAIGILDDGTPYYGRDTKYTIWHSGNSNLSTIDWAANQMIANSFKLASGTPTLSWDDNAKAWHLSGNFYADGFISAGGSSPGGGASGIDLAAMWGSLTNSISDAYATTKIAAAHIPDMAFTYGYLKSGDVSGVYLPLAGGTMSNTNLVTNLNADLLDGHHEHEFVANNRGLINNFNSAYGSSVHFIDPNYTNGPSGVEYGQALVLHADGDTTAQLVFPFSRTTAFLRVGKENGTIWQSWREFAFLDSNVASATRLQTAKLIWGQSFDGSSDISGRISVKDEAGYYHFDNDGVTLYCYIGHDSNLQGSWFYNGISGTSITLYDSGGCLINTNLSASSFVKVGGTSSQFLKADGGVDSNTYLTTGEAVSTYLPLTGGTINSSSNIPLTLNTTHSSSQNVIGFQAGGNAVSYIGYYPIYGFYIQNYAAAGTPFINITSDGSLKRNNSDVFYHSGNLTKSVLTGLLDASGGYYLPLTGGTISGSLSITGGLSVISSIYLSSSLTFGTSSSASGHLNASAGELRWYDQSDWRTVYHSGNSNLSTVDWTCLSLNAYSSINARGVAALYHWYNDSLKMYIGYDVSGDLVHLYTPGIKVIINTSANVGIGTTSPAYKLDVNGSIGCTTLTASDGVATSWSDVWSSGSVSHPWYGMSFRDSVVTLSGYFGVRVHTGNCDLYIDMGGVGVGTHPASGHALDVAGVIHASTGIYTEGYVSAGGLASSSDERLKSGIKDFGYSAEMLMALRPREWDWNEKSYMKGHAAGVVAQELQQVMPYAIVERQYLSVNYDMLHGLEIAGLQDHETRIRQLEAENRELKRRLNMN